MAKQKKILVWSEATEELLCRARRARSAERGRELTAGESSNSSVVRWALAVASVCAEGMSAADGRDLRIGREVSRCRA